MMAELEIQKLLEKTAPDQSEYSDAVQELPPSEHKFIAPLPTDLAPNIVGSWRWDAKRNLFSVDPAIALLLQIQTNIEDATAALAKLIAIVHPEDRQRLHGAVRRAIMDGQVLCMTFRIIEPRGAPRLILALGRAAFDDRVEVASFSGMIIDLTEERGPQ